MTTKETIMADIKTVQDPTFTSCPDCGLLTPDPYGGKEDVWCVVCRPTTVTR